MQLFKCCKCGHHKLCTDHHVAPKTFYGKEGLTIKLCRNCHDEIEAVYERLEGKKVNRNKRNKLEKVDYYRICITWVTGGDYEN
jgi:hypothetical protein